MPIIDIQSRFRELGRIRLGQQVPTGKVFNSGPRKGQPITRPTKLPRFRLTSPWQHLIEQASERFGGTPGPVEIDGTQQHEVIVEVDALPVVIPPGDVFSQWYELWTGGGCERRCDGERQTLVDRKCQCPADPMERQEAAAKGKACKPTTRLRLFLPDVADVGIWRLESHGFHAAAELGGAAGLVEAATRQGAMIPADLRLSEREGSRRPGQPRKKFYVPSISFRGALGPILDQLGILEAGSDMPSLLGAVQPRPSLTEGTRAALPPTGSSFDPVPTERASLPAPPPEPAAPPPVEKDPASVAPAPPVAPPPFDPPKPSNPTPDPVPAPEPFEPPEASESDEENASGEGRSYSGPQIIAIKLGDHGVTDRAHRLEVVVSIIGRPISSSKDLTHAEISTVIEALNSPDFTPPAPGKTALAAPAEVLTPEVVDSPPPRRRRAEPASSPETWDAERWRGFLRDRGVKVAELRKACRELDQPIETLDDIAGSGIAEILVNFVEDKALEKGAGS